MGKEARGMVKLMDEKDEMFCGFCSFNVIDQDGYPKMIKGCALADTPLYIDREGGKVILTASFAPKPHGYLEIQRDNQLYVSGSIWYGESKKSSINCIGKLIPKQMEIVSKEMEKSGSTTFECKLELPFLKNAPKRLATVVFDTVEERFLTKISSFRVELTEADWTEWKQHKVKFWRINKAQGGATEEDDKDEKKDEKKD